MTKYTLVKFPEVAYGELEAPTVTASRYTFSTQTTNGAPEATLFSRTMCDVGSPHPLNGTVYPTTEDAHRAGFEAGLIGYYVRGAQ